MCSKTLKHKILKHGAQAAVKVLTCQSIGLPSRVNIYVGAVVSIVVGVANALLWTTNKGRKYGTIKKWIIATASWDNDRSFRTAERCSASCHVHCTLSTEIQAIDYIDSISKSKFPSSQTSGIPWIQYFFISSASWSDYEQMWRPEQKKKRIRGPTPSSPKSFASSRNYVTPKSQA